MKPIAIFRHVAFEGPGFLAEFLDARNIPWQLIAIDEGEAVPKASADYSGLVFMGGPMSVNDDLPWIAQELDLILDAVAGNIPVLGHCLGGQLISKALGGVVSKNPVVEIGWGPVAVADTESARCWLGELRVFDAFHWHGETFSLPAGATRLLSGAYCANQGYTLGPHLALQCHIEMTSALIASWCEAGAAEIKANLGSPAVQSSELMQQRANLPQLHAVAERLYTQWISALAG
ncbi:type 1 glutamine amidotransferase [Gallionella capsiferriformans]|jgi:GMP synthase-like glutamine amidotransferase|uniref:Glutamine amidotransferase class-I n=1 Tax=Gallionella capsiferriformans (strain ES-2) TaxID=395494 RepID=D9SJ83_GALCS|nr:type 1 glutamine amidotransferase [Gallionella capsiferriformans]ADL56271.1 glutamine amidotransferase class-I [Gallionella capsiferriformans ES-2]